VKNKKKQQANDKEIINGTTKKAYNNCTNKWNLIKNKQIMRLQKD
jgi:hypothetical protein